MIRPTRSQLNSRELTKSTELQDSDSDIENIRMLPALILHADWSSNPKKRWMCTATLDGEVYRLEAPIQVEATASLVRRAVQLAKDGGSVLGFDFPIRVPRAYARLAGIDRFLSHLPELGSGPWREFFNIARQPTEVSIRRPFYPARPGGTLQQHLVAGIGVRSPQPPSVSSLRWLLAVADSRLARRVLVGGALEYNEARASLY